MATCTSPENSCRTSVMMASGASLQTISKCSKTSRFTSAFRAAHPICTQQNNIFHNCMLPSAMTDARMIPLSKSSRKILQGCRSAIQINDKKRSLLLDRFPKSRYVYGEREVYKHIQQEGCVRRFAQHAFCIQDAAFNCGSDV